MRINPNPLSDLLSALSQTQQQINSDLRQTASGQSVNQPSDNPAAAAQLARNADQTAEADQFLRSVNSLSGEMQNADSALNSVITTLQRAISLGVEGANGTLNASDRAALAAEVQGIQSELLSLANLSYQGNFVFAGTATQAAPYVLDSTSPSGVRYVGNSGVNQITVGNHLTVAANLPGSQLFSAAGADVFQSIQDLITGLQNGTGIDTAVDAVSSAYQHINAQRVFYGNVMNQLTSQQTFLNNETTQLAQQQNNLGGADLSKVLSDLVNAQTSRQATLEAIGQTQQTNLFNYIK
ncbi:MAG TPA: flagellar hook-associated protein FlgL [Candidatus Sulfotelmatobacter sp.]|nr:flagellar hook-associated protein FlgL [Candidatus Sulfotelmatobacter sp.]